MSSSRKTSGSYDKPVAISGKQLADMRQVLSIQGDDGNWNYNDYMHGFYNGLELMLAIVEDREPVYRDAPDEWLSDKSPGELPTLRKLTQKPSNTTKGGK